MLGAVVLAAFALTGPLWSSGDLRVSDAQPRAGRDYVAMSWAGESDFNCAAAIGRRAVTARIVSRNGKAVCVVRVPKGTAGKRLSLAYSFTQQTEYGVTHADGLAIRPKLIRR